MDQTFKIVKPKRNRAELKKAAAQWLEYLTTHSKEESYENFLQSEDTYERFRELGLKMDIFDSIHRHYTKKFGKGSTKNKADLTMAEGIDSPWAVGNALFSHWRYDTHWSYDSFKYYQPKVYIRFMEIIIANCDKKRVRKSGRLNTTPKPGEQCLGKDI